MKNELLNFIKEFNLSTSDVADALDRSGHVANILPINSKHRCVGPTQYLFAWHGTNYCTHRELSSIQENSIVFVDGIECGQKAIMGHLMLDYSLNHRKAAAVVVNGYVRDVEQIIKHDMPVWASGRSPIICARTQVDIWKAQIDARRVVYEDSIMVCDDTGVVIIMHHQMSGRLLNKLEVIRDREAHWHKMLNEGKTTFEITCLP